MMNTIALLLCALTSQVMSQNSDVLPARIHVRQATLSVNSKLYLTCSTFGLKKQTEVYVYLCKDGVGIQVEKQAQDQNDTQIIIKQVQVHQSGSYSCVYSKSKYEPSAVKVKGYNTILVRIIPNYLPADISVAGSSIVTEGDNVEFKCTFPGTLRTLGDCQLIQAYLSSNETILQVQVFNVTRMEAAFTIEGAVMRDSGHYSCVVLPSKCIKEHEFPHYGNNFVSLEVRVNWFVTLIASCGLITLMLILGLCLWALGNKQGRGTAKKSVSTGHSALSNSWSANQQPNIHMLEQQEQTEGADLDTQDSESFSTDEEEGYQNQVVKDCVSSDSAEEEGVYNVVDDPPAMPESTSMYAESSKYKVKLVT